MGLDKVLAPLAVSLLLLSGCSTQSKPDYDPIESIEYEKCFDALIDNAEWEQIPASYLKQVWDEILEFCEAYKPRKQG